MKPKRYTFTAEHLQGITLTIHEKPYPGADVHPSPGWLYYECRAKGTYTHQGHSYPIDMRTTVEPHQRAEWILCAMAHDQGYLPAAQSLAQEMLNTAKKDQ